MPKKKMKRRNKLLALLLSCVMAMLMVAGCGSSASDSDTGTQSSESSSDAQEAESDTEFEEMIIGCYCMDWTTSPYSEYKTYLEEYIGPYYNIDFEFNTESADAEGEKTFMEKMGALGAKGVLAITTYSLDNCLEIASQYGMQYATNVEITTDLSSFTDEQIEAFAGAVGAETEMRVEGGYELAMAVLEQMDLDSHVTVKALSLNPDSGIPLTAGPFLAMEGIQNAVDELEAEGVDIDLEVFYPSGSSASDWSAATDNALASIGNTENACVISSTSAAYSIQSFVNAGVAGTVLFGAQEVVSEENQDYFEDGLITAGFEVGLPCNMPALTFVVLYNAITGNKFVTEEGMPVQIEQTTPVIVSSMDEYNEILDNTYSYSGNSYYSPEILNEVIAIVNPDVTSDDFEAFANEDLRLR